MIAGAKLQKYSILYITSACFFAVITVKYQT